MTVRNSYRRFAAVLAAGFAAAGSSDAFAQPGPDPGRPGSPASVQALLDRYAPGVDLGSVNVPADAFATGAAAQDAAARARAQSVLDRVVPGLVTLGDRGVRIAAPGAPVVDTRQTVGPSADPAQEALHELALNETLRSMRDADYARAARWVAAVAGDRAKDGDVRQLESLVLASNGRFDEAAEAAKAGLRQSTPWDQERLNSLLPVYGDLYALLRSEAQRNPSSGKILFLLAYHELMMGRTRDASRTLDLAAKHLPDGWLTASVRSRFEE